jgi:DNA-binding response OmpR family regulator
MYASLQERLMISTIFESHNDQQVVSIKNNPLIMVVDDNVELLEEVQDLLKLANYDVIALSDGSKVLDAASKNKPDLLLLDLKMSPKSGFQIAVETRNSLFLKDVPVIAMTGFYTEKQHFLMMKLCGIKTAILKPFRPLNLFTKIEFALGSGPEEGDSGGT